MILKVLNFLTKNYKIKHNSYKVFLLVAANEQGFAMLGDLKNVKPVTAAD